jgi:hypothetical protein
MGTDGFIVTFFRRFRFYGGYVFAVERTWEEAVDQGDVTGASILRMFGYNAAVADLDALWEPAIAYTWQTADQRPWIVSDSANDDAAPATGAQTVRVWWLNAANVEATEDVALNGVAAVQMTAATVRRINRVEVMAVGTTGWNEGNLSVLDTAAAVLMAYVPIGRNANDGIIQTVPAGKVDYIRRVSFGSTTESTRGLLRVRATPTSPWLSDVVFSEESPTNEYTLDIPYKIPAGYDYLIQLEALSGAGVVKADLYGWRMNA